MRLVTRQLILCSRSPGRNSRTSDSAVPSPCRAERCAPLTPIGLGTVTGASRMEAEGTTFTPSVGRVCWARTAPKESLTSTWAGPTGTSPQRWAVIRIRAEPSPASEPQGGARSTCGARGSVTEVSTPGAVVTTAAEVPPSSTVGRVTRMCAPPTSFSSARAVRRASETAHQASSGRPAAIRAGEPRSTARVSAAPAIATARKSAGVGRSRSVRSRRTALSGGAELTPDHRRRPGPPSRPARGPARAPTRPRRHPWRSAATARA